MKVEGVKVKTLEVVTSIKVGVMVKEVVTLLVVVV